VVYCSRADLIGTPQPSGGHILRVSEADDANIAEAAKAVGEVLAGAPEGKVAIRVAQWANIIGAVELRCQGKLGAGFSAALKGLSG
jgi:hypothetical protein